jgi:hypothetical protein
MPDDPRALSPRAPDPTLPTNDVRRGIRWWNPRTEPERSRWLAEAGSARPVDAWKAFKQHREAAASIATGADVP